MLLNFSNGIVQKQPLTPFLYKNRNSIALNSATAPLILTFSHGSSNYLAIHPDIIKQQNKLLGVQSRMHRICLQETYKWSSENHSSPQYCAC
jgi:hypothetical protein